MFSPRHQPKRAKRRTPPAQEPRANATNVSKKRRKQNCWYRATEDFKRQLQSLDAVKDLLPAVRHGAQLTFLLIVRGASARTKAMFRRLVAIKMPKAASSRSSAAGAKAAAASKPSTCASPAVNKRQLRTGFRLEAGGSAIRSELAPETPVFVAHAAGSSCRLQRGKTYSVAEVGEMVLKVEVREARARAKCDEAATQAAAAALNSAAANVRVTEASLV